MKVRRDRVKLGLIPGHVSRGYETLQIGSVCLFSLVRSLHLIMVVYGFGMMVSFGIVSHISFIGYG